MQDSSHPQYSTDRGRRGRGAAGGSSVGGGGGGSPPTPHRAPRRKEDRPRAWPATGRRVPLRRGGYGAARRRVAPARADTPVCAVAPAVGLPAARAHARCRPPPGGARHARSTAPVGRAGVGAANNPPPPPAARVGGLGPPRRAGPRAARRRCDRINRRRGVEGVGGEGGTCRRNDVSRGG